MGVEAAFAAARESGDWVLSGEIALAPPCGRSGGHVRDAATMSSARSADLKLPAYYAALTRMGCRASGSRKATAKR
jgi:hypothetical protein